MLDLIINSIFNSLTYIFPLGCARDCWLVDCGDVDKVIEQGLNVRGVLLTHAHFDHIYGLNRLMEVFPDALVYTNAEGKKGLMNPKWNFSRYHEDVEPFVFCKPENVRVIDSERTIDLEKDLTVETFFTPGHEPSCVSFRIDKMLLTGDSYIPGVKVVTNFPRSNRQQALKSLARLQEMERTGLQILPGHWVENEKQ